jgi:hypothetical protein
VGDDGDLGIGLEAVQRDPVGVQELLHLRGHGVEDRGRRRPIRGQRRHPPQRGLLVGEPLHLRARGGVRDGGGHQVAELRNAALRLPRDGSAPELATAIG